MHSKNLDCSHSAEVGSAMEIACVIRAPTDSSEREDFSVETLKQIDSELTLMKNEELVGNIIRISCRKQEGRVNKMYFLYLMSPSKQKI